MTPASCARLRRAAALLHSIPGLRATVCSGDGCAITITPEAVHDHDHHPDRGHDGRGELEPARDRCHPCLFRRTIVTATAHVEIGNHVGLFGLGVDVEPTIEFFAEGRCRIARNGLISWGFDDGDIVVCIATLLDPDIATNLMAGMAGVTYIDNPDTNAENPASTHPGSTRVDLTHDDELDVTLVYAVVPGTDRAAQNAAAATLVRLMAAFGAEEIATDPSLLAVAS